MNSFLKKFFYGTSIANDTGTYNVTLTGTLSTLASADMMFRITVINPCDAFPIVRPNYPPGRNSFEFNYTISTSTVVFHLPDFLINNTACILNLTLTNDDYSPYFAQSMTWNGTTGNLTVSEPDNLYSGIHNLTLTATFLNGNQINHYNVTLNLLDLCTGTVMSTFPISLSYNLPMANPA